MTSFPARLIQGLALGLGAIAAVVFLFTQVVRVNGTTAGFLFLVVVLGVATARGFAAAAAVSVAAMLCLNYFFLPPVGKFTIADPENWAALFTFLLTALVAGHLSDRAQREAAQASNSQRETERLYALSRAILLTDAGRSIGAQAAQSIAQIFDLRAVAILDAKAGKLHRGGLEEIDDLGPALEEVARKGHNQRDADTQVWPIALGGNPIGALAVRGMTASDGAMQSVLNLVAIALERVRSEEAANRAEAARQSEEFKSTLLDAIAHEFKTPLTSIKAAATGLRMSVTGEPADHRELTSIIEEETDRLNRLVTEAVKMAEIDAGKTAPQRAHVSALDLFERTRQSFEGRGEDRIQINIRPGEEHPLVWADSALAVLALRQVVDNALKYSGAASMVDLQAEAGKNSVVLRIVDQGPGVPDRERQRIFEKFYRGPGARAVPGTGLGLHIAREIARIHGGDLWVEPGRSGGAAFCLALPLAKDAAK